MTRINCIPVTELSYLHLLAEYRELPRVSKLARPAKAPAEYVLGTGHVTFFYNKGKWLKRRFEEEIVPELQRRGVDVKYTHYRDHPEGLNEDWTPTPEAMALNRDRIATRLGTKLKDFGVLTPDQMLNKLAEIAFAPPTIIDVVKRKKPEEV